MGLANWKAEGILSGYQEIICSRPLSKPKISGTIFPTCGLGLPPTRCVLRHTQTSKRRAGVHIHLQLSKLSLSDLRISHKWIQSSGIKQSRHANKFSHLLSESVPFCHYIHQLTRKFPFGSPINCFIPAFNSH